MNSRSKSAQRESQSSSRREFLARTGKVAIGSALAGVAVPHVHAAEENTIRLALIGSGYRGSGATVNAFNAPGGPVKLIAMADLHQARLEAAHKNLVKASPDKVDVPPDRRFIGFDAYRKAIDCLRPGDVAVLTTNPAFRVAHLDYAVAKGVNVFMEKAFAVDPVGARRLLKAAEESEKKNLKIGAGVMCRHSANRQELIRRIRDGQLGQILLMRAYRMHPFGGMGRKPAGENEVYWQIRNAINMLWVSGGFWSEADIHQVDEMCWIKDGWPVAAHGIGGRAANSTDCGQNLDNATAEWTFADGTKAYYTVRGLPNCHNEFATYLHGTKCGAQFSGQTHVATTLIYKDQRFSPDNVAWEAPKEKIGPHQAEWNVLIDAIRHNRPHNEAKRAAMSTIADLMGRAAIHMGRIITFDEVIASNFQWVAGGIDNLNEHSTPPVQCDSQGRYPVPIPGQWREV